MSNEDKLHFQAIEMMEELNEMAKHYQYSNKEKELTITSKEGNVIRVDMKPKGSA